MIVTISKTETSLSTISHATRGSIIQAMSRASGQPEDHYNVSLIKEGGGIEYDQQRTGKRHGRIFRSYHVTKGAEKSSVLSIFELAAIAATASKGRDFVRFADDADFMHAAQSVDIIPV